MRIPGSKKNLVESKSRGDRIEMLEYEEEKLSISKQSDLLGLNRTGLYYKPVQISDEEYHIKRIIDEVYTRHPEYGYRRMTVILKRDYGIGINKKRTRRYMREMGIHGFCPGPNLSKRLHAKYVHPYLLRGLNIDQPNHVWSVDITYCRMKKGFMYMVAIIDWYSHFIVGFSLSNTLEKTFVLETIQKAIKSYSAPQIMNCDYVEKETMPKSVRKCPNKRLSSENSA
jgi:putative transposase